MIGLQNFPNIIPPNPDFLSGRIKDNPGDGSGTPVNQLTNGDIQEFFAKLMLLAGITPNNLPDCEYTGHQSITALWNFINGITSDIIIGIMGGYTANDLIILWGCNITTGGTSSIAPGAIFYNGIIYKVDGNSVSGSSGLVYKIDLSEDSNEIILANTGSGSGIADYGANTVLPLFPLDESFRTVGAGGQPSFANSFIANIGTRTLQFRKKLKGKVEIQGTCSRASDTTGAKTIFTLPSGYFDTVNNIEVPVMVQPFAGGDFVPAYCIIQTGGIVEVISSTNYATILFGNIYYYL